MSGPKLTAFQLRHLTELADLRDNGSTGEAFWRPSGANEHSAAHLLSSRGLLKAQHHPFGYELTDEGYAAVRAGRSPSGKERP